MSRRKQVGLMAVVAGAVVLVGVFLFCWQSSKLPPEAGKALHNAERFELFSINPDQKAFQIAKEGDGYHRWPVLGQAVITDPAVRARLVDALEDGASANDGEVHNCFWPRHGIRVTHAGHTYDFLICFFCYQMEIYREDGQRWNVFITDSPKAVFNAEVTAAGLPLPAQGEKGE